MVRLFADGDQDSLAALRYGVGKGVFQLAYFVATQRGAGLIVALDPQFASADGVSKVGAMFEGRGPIAKEDARQGGKAGAQGFGQ
jgi:hypothetical protein